MSNVIDELCALLEGIGPSGPARAQQFRSHIAALEADNETFRQRQALWEEAATALYGYSEFIGPCAHGRDPWDRCDTCGEKNAVWTAQQVIIKMENEHRRALVRARNEGREEVAKTFDCPCGLDVCRKQAEATRIRAMKEPEQ